jgi:hypothetical protein
MTPAGAGFGRLATFVLLTFLLLTPSLLSSQTLDQVGERAQGMGGAFVAVADDASAIYWNPAGLANLPGFDAQMSLSGLGQGAGSAGAPDPTHTGLLAVAMPAFGAGYYQVQTAVSSAGDRKNGGSGEVRVSELATGNFGVSLLQTIVNTVVIGTTLRLVNASGTTAFDLDAGATASVGDFRMAFTARNLRQGLDAVRQVRAGVALAPRSRPEGVYGPFSVAFDADLTRTPTANGDQRQAALGSEQWWAKGTVGTRLGVHWSTINDLEPAISGGVSLKLPRSVFFEGHVTKGRKARDSGWGVGTRLTF